MKLSRLPLKQREPFLHLGRGIVDVKDGALVFTNKQQGQIRIPVGTIACLMLEPGISITHEAVKVCARQGCLLMWCGEAGVRLYAASTTAVLAPDKLLEQIRLASDPEQRLRVVKKMFRLRFGREAPDRRSVDQIRGIEGAIVKEQYEKVARSYGVAWRGRKFPSDSGYETDEINRALSCAHACLYGVTEAAIVIAGYSSSIGFLHQGQGLSFVYDIADLYKFSVTVPVAFEVVLEGCDDVEGETRRRLRDQFRKHKLMSKLIPDIERVLDVGD